MGGCCCLLSCNVHEQQLVIPGPVGGSHNRLHASHSSPSLPPRYASAAPPWQGRSRSAPVPATSPPLAHSSISQRQLQVQRLACLLDAPALPPQGSSPPQSQNAVRLAPALLSRALAVTKPLLQVGPSIAQHPHRHTAARPTHCRSVAQHRHILTARSPISSADRSQPPVTIAIAATAPARRTVAKHRTGSRAAAAGQQPHSTASRPHSCLA